MNKLIFIIICLSSLSGYAQPLYQATDFTPPRSFMRNHIEGPAVDTNGNVYAVNCSTLGDIGMVTPQGDISVYVQLPSGLAGNGIRFGMDENMYVAEYIGHHILQVNTTNRQVSVYAHNSTMNQPNDLTIMENNIIFTSDPIIPQEVGQFWRVDQNQVLTKVDSNMSSTNGIEVGLGDSILYVNEIATRIVWAYDLSPQGEISNKRLFHQFLTHGMDGMRSDTAGNLFIARYGKGTIAMVSRTGQLVREIQLAGNDPTNITFGGVDGRTCYVTSYDNGNLETFRTEYPGRTWWIRQKRKLNLLPPGFHLMENNGASLFSVYAKSNVIFEFLVDHSGSFKSLVYDIQGKQLHSVVKEGCSPGSHRIVWNRTSINGKRAAKGAYIVALKEDTRLLEVRRFVLK